tara:strand:- start:129 stop:317 length:189 start_codon:yes stop_codon:yes gene_type:complete
MRPIFILLLLFFLQNCSTTTLKNNDKGLKIDIYEKDMTYEKFKKIVIDYAEKASFPQLTEND